MSVTTSHGGLPERWANDVRSLLMHRVSGMLALETVIYSAADRSIAFLGDASESERPRAITRVGHQSLSVEECRRIYESSSFARTVQGFFDSAPPRELLEGMKREGIGEVIGAAQPESDGRSALGFTVMVDFGVPVGDRVLSSWGTLVMQLGAVAEARALIARGDVEAALEAEPVGKAREAARAAMSELDRRRTRAVRRVGEEESQEVLDLFTFMLDRGFVVLEHGACGGKRRLVAVRLRRPEWCAVRRLSADERLVVDQAARGLSNKEIGFELGIEEATVASRLRRAELRLGLSSRVELVRLARAMGYAR